MAARCFRLDLPVSLYPLFLALPEPAPTRVIAWNTGCSFCRRWVSLFRALDWLGLHRFVGSDEPEAFEDPRVIPERADRALQLVAGRRHAEGFDAVRRILAVCPPTCLLAPLLWLPPVAAVGTRAYARAAARRSCPVI